MAREAWEETGATLHPEHRRLIGCYLLTPRSGMFAGQTRYCPVFVAEAWGFAPIPPGSESRGLVLAAWEDVAEVYFTWDATDVCCLRVRGRTEERAVSGRCAGLGSNGLTRPGRSKEISRR